MLFIVDTYNDTEYWYLGEQIIGLFYNYTKSKGKKFIAGRLFAY